MMVCKGVVVSFVIALGFLSFFTQFSCFQFLPNVFASSPVRPNLPAVLPKILRDVEVNYQKENTLVAEFTQTNEVVALKQKRASSGLIMIKRPNKIRWETLKPDRNLLVSDGKKFWYYTPPFEEGERGQLIEKKASEFQTKLANALLSGSFQMTQDMKIKQQGTKPADGRFILTPKPGSAGTVEQAEIVINVDKSLIEKVILRHKGGNYTEISLSKIQLGKEVADDLFFFHPPPETDRVTE